MQKDKSRFINHYLIFVLCIMTAGLILRISWHKKDCITFIADSTGYISLIILAISLLVGSLKLMFNKINTVSYNFRRDLGITGAILAIVHSVAGLFVHFRGNNWQYFLKKTETGFSIRLDNFGLANYFGLFSALIIFLLLLTSNNYSIRKLGPARWKNFQRLSYLMFILAVMHSLFYRIVMNNERLIYTFYLPLFLIILVFQLIGIRLKIRMGENISK